MIKPARVIENPITGEKMEFLKTAGDTRGKLLQIHMTVKPHGFVASAHIHPLQEERFYVQSGTLRLQVNGNERVLGAGQDGVIPSATPHAWWNAGQDELQAIVEFRPALKTQEVLSTLFGLARDGMTDKKGVPNLLQIAVILQKYRYEMYLAKPPVPLQKLLFSSIAWMGLLLGYHPDYAYCPDVEAPSRQTDETGLGLLVVDTGGC
jgi:quercetin dioxygenase-like cupin family protein